MWSGCGGWLWRIPWEAISILRGSLTCYHTHLLTFCPPGPDDLLKVSSQMSRGMVSGSSLASHCLAAASSASSVSAGRLAANDLVVT